MLKEEEGLPRKVTGSGVNVAVSLCHTLLNHCEKINQMDIVDMCRIAISLDQRRTQSNAGSTAKGSALLTPSKNNEQRSKDSVITKAIPHSAVKMDSKIHAINFSIRFNHEEKEIDVDKLISTWFLLEIIN